MIYRFRICSEEEFEKGRFIGSGKYIIQTNNLVTDKYVDKYIDLRLVCDDYLTGWRMYGCVELKDEVWGEAKLVHNPAVLDNANLKTIEQGVFRWYSLSSPGCWLLELEGDEGEKRFYSVERSSGLPANIQSTLVKVAEERKLPLENLIELVEDGLMAREWIINRICGIGMYLGAEEFSEESWRDVLRKKSFEELRECLNSWEKRFYSNSNGAKVRLTKPAKLNEEVGKDSELINRLLELVGGR